jgi:1-deoxy-D-xylulose-5-phosphate reductoisomerase
LSKRLCILGSTGSIGRQAIEVVDEIDTIEVVALGARNNWGELAAQAKRHGGAMLAVTNEDSVDPLRGELGQERAILAGPNALSELVRRSRPEVVLTAVVGAAGLEPTLAAIRAGADIALANKETLVCAGELVIPAARRAGSAILPVDSEHAGIFQCLQSGRRDEVRRVTITSSGGALRDWAPHEAASAGVEDALNHPTWQMGPKITIDSATLMNKTLEVIEAHWLFGLEPEQIDVVIHPQSIVHAMVEFCDGSVMAQLARPDMKGPIAYALGHPRRTSRDVAPLDLAAMGELEFRPLSEDNRRAVNLAYEVIRRGRTAGAVLNAANEAAVEAFLNREIAFGEIVPLVEGTLRESNEGIASNRSAAPADTTITRSEILSADAWARERVKARLAESQTANIRAKRK